MPTNHSRSRSLRLVAVLGTSLGLGAMAPADIIQARFNDVTPRRTVSVTADGGSSYLNTYAGSFLWTRTGGDYLNPDLPETFATNCIEINQHISFGANYNYTTRDVDLSPVPGQGMGATRAELLSEFFGRYYQPQFTDHDLAAAFQIGVWEITHDDGLDLEHGMFRAVNNGAWYALAQGWVSALDGAGPHLQLLAMTNATAQDQVFVVPGAGSCVLLGIGGVFGCAGRRRRPAWWSRRVIGLAHSSAEASDHRRVLDAPLPLHAA